MSCYGRMLTPSTSFGSAVWRSVEARMGTTVAWNQKSSCGSGSSRLLLLLLLFPSLSFVLYQHLDFQLTHSPSGMLSASIDQPHGSFPGSSLTRSVRLSSLLPLRPQLELTSSDVLYFFQQSNLLPPRRTLHFPSRQPNR